MRQLDIVLPCYNPLQNWAEAIIVNINNLKLLLSDTEIFIYLVNDGSTQGIQSADIDLLRASIKNFNYLFFADNQGKGFALRKGIEATKHAICIYTDVDFPYKIESMAAVYKALIEEENDIDAGIRDDTYNQEVTGTRAPLSKLLKFINSKVFHLPINDTQCGIKGFNQKGRKIFLQTIIKRYLFDLEFVYLAAKDPLINFKAVPVTFRPGIFFRKFNTRIILTEVTSFIKLLLHEYLR